MEPKSILRWTIYTFRSKLQWLGEVEASSEVEAIKIGAEAFRQDAKRLMAAEAGLVMNQTAVDHTNVRQTYVVRDIRAAPSELLQ